MIRPSNHRHVVVEAMLGALYAVVVCFVLGVVTGEISLAALAHLATSRVGSILVLLGSVLAVCVYIGSNSQKR